MSQTENENYQAMSQELEEVMERLQSEDIDIDDVMTNLGRGLELVSSLEKYLSHAENQIKRLKVEFDIDK